MKPMELNMDVMVAALSTCSCSGLRRTVRVVTNHFDKAFEPLGLKCSQINVLMATAVHGPATVRTLAEVVVLDASSMSRALDPLEREGLIARDVGESRRDRQVSITEAGMAKLMEAGPIWQKAQAEFGEILGTENMEAFNEILQRTGQMASDAA